MGWRRMGWSNDQLSLIILNAAASGYSGFFVYSPSPGPGNLIGSWAAAAGTDPYGNAYPAGLDVAGNFNLQGSDYIINSAGAFFYTGTPATGNLFASIASTNGTDAFGNAYQSGFQVHGVTTSPGTGSASFTAAGPFTWTAPSNLSGGTVTVQNTGGGGGSGSDETGNPFTSAGGGGGEYASQVIAVTPGTVYNGTVGAGGIAGAVGANNPGGPGGATTFTGDSATVTANGGGGGASGGGSGAGGAGGTGSTNTTHFNGGAGGANSNTGRGGGGGSSAGSASAGNPGQTGTAGGAGGAAVTGGGPGASALVSGAGVSPATGPGGGAAGANSPGVNEPGAAGFQGQVLLSWTTASAPSESGANIEMTTLSGVPIQFFSTGVSEESTGANLQVILESPGASEFIDFFISGARISTASGYVFIALSGPAKDASLSPFGQLFWNDGTTNHGLLSWGLTGIQVQDLIAGDAINYQTERLTLLNTGQTITATTPTAITGLTTASAGNVGTGTYRIKAWISYQGSVAAGAPTFVLNGPATSFSAAGNEFITNGAPAAVNAGGVTLGGNQVGPTFQTSPQQLKIDALFTFSAAGTVSMTGQTSAAADHLIINGAYVEIYPTGT